MKPLYSTQGNAINDCDAFRIQNMYPETNRIWSLEQLESRCKNRHLNKCECIGGIPKYTCAFAGQKEDCQKCRKSQGFHNVIIGSGASEQNTMQCRRYKPWSLQKPKSKSDSLYRKKRSTSCDNVAEFMDRKTIGNTQRKNGKSIIFLIDNTYSMSGEIEDVKKLLKSFINPKDSTSTYLRDFQNIMLMTFNDPCIGPMLIVNDISKTKNTVELINAIDKIDVFGGEDSPELMLSGMEKALHQADYGSVLYAVTDDWIKDVELSKKVERLALLKSITIHFVLTFNENYRKEFTNSVTKRRGSINVIEKLRRITNGLVFFSNLKEENARNRILSRLRSHITKKTGSGEQIVYMKEKFASKQNEKDSSVVSIDSTILDSDVFRISVTGVTKVSLSRISYDNDKTENECYTASLQRVVKSIENCKCSDLIGKKLTRSIKRNHLNKVPQCKLINGKKPERFLQVQKLCKLVDDTKKDIAISQVKSRCLSLAEDAVTDGKSRNKLKRRFKNVDVPIEQKEILATLNFDNNGTADDEIIISKIIKDIDRETDDSLLDSIQILKNCTVPNYATIDITPGPLFKETITNPFNIRNKLVIDTELYYNETTMDAKSKGEYTHSIIVTTISASKDNSLGLYRNSISIPENVFVNYDSRRKRDICNKKLYKLCELCKKGVEKQTDFDYRIFSILFKFKVRIL